ncbi:unnamed protein product, partial [Polarella glacialis]
MSEGEGHPLQRTMSEGQVQGGSALRPLSRSPPRALGRAGTVSFGTGPSPRLPFFQGGDGERQRAKGIRPRASQRTGDAEARAGRDHPRRGSADGRRADFASGASAGSGTPQADSRTYRRGQSVDAFSPLTGVPRGREGLAFNPKQILQREIE